jgi:hypothetical protein
MKDSKPTETPSHRAKRTLSRRPKKVVASEKFAVLKVLSTKLTSSGPSDPPIPFQHINGTEQIRNLPSGGGSGNWAQDLFDVLTPVSPYILTLTYVPLVQSELVSWNGLVLRPGVLNDYVIAGNIITLNINIVVRVGDGFLVSYQH